MTRRQHRIITLAVCLFCALVSAADGQATISRRRSPLANVKRVPIAIDDSRPGAAVALTRNFYFVFDGSGSMADPPAGDCNRENRFNRKIDGAKWAVAEFMTGVPNDINLGLYVFDANRRSEVVPLAPNNRDSFVRAVNGVKAGGGTPLAKAIRHATDQLVTQYQKQLGYGEYRLVVVTDGLADDIPAAALYAAQRGIAIYAIGLCIGAQHSLRQYAVSYRAADSFQDLRKGLEETLAELPDVAPTDFQ